MPKSRGSSVTPGGRCWERDWGGVQGSRGRLAPFITMARERFGRRDAVPVKSVSRTPAEGSSGLFWSVYAHAAAELLCPWCFSLLHSPEASREHADQRLSEKLENAPQHRKVRPVGAWVFREEQCSWELRNERSVENDKRRHNDGEISEATRPAREGSGQGARRG